MMTDLLKIMMICFTVMAVVLPVAFLIAISLPANSDFRELCLRACRCGVALLAVCYFGMPFDIVPDVFFPVGFADDAIILGLGYLSARKAMSPHRN